ncbi:MAG: hypothetical protein HQ504_05415 [Rhodospirillaceae bacterium]|nr:hypothetical protein [Rhodospirillaceae bacterium]
MMNINLTKWICRGAVVALVLAAALPLGACGRKGAPDFPEGTEYPREYPSDPKKE